MSEDFWADFEERELSDRDENENESCCLCSDRNNLRSSIDADSHVLYDGRDYSYRTIIHDCFRIRTPALGRTDSDPRFLVCDACTLLLRQTFWFFLRIKNAQLKLQRNVDEKPIVFRNADESESPIGSALDKIKRENPDAEETSNFFSVGDVFLKLETELSDRSSEIPDGVYPSRRKAKRVKTRFVSDDEDSTEPLIEIRERRTNSKRQEKEKKSKLKKDDDEKADKFECVRCAAKFRKWGELKKHASREHGDESLKKCKSRKSGKSGARVPYELKGDEVACAICQETFPVHKLLVQHMSAHYPNFVCDVCGKSFVTKQQVHAHCRDTHSSEVHACDMCPKTFKTRVYLKHHKSAVHSVGDPYRTKCPKCPARFKSHHYRVNHLIRVHGEEPPNYECKLCPRKFKASNRLSAHVNRDHLKQRNHRCPVCDQSFFDGSLLQNHMLKHTGIKDFECERCGKRFGLKTTLVGHMKSHDNIRDHACPVCDKAFVQKCTLKGHMKTHEKANTAAGAAASGAPGATYGGAADFQAPRGN